MHKKYRGTSQSGASQGREGVRGWGKECVGKKLSNKSPRMGFGEHPKQFSMRFDGPVSEN